MNYNQMIDHTYLKADATQKDIDNLIADAIKYNFKTICVNSSWVPYAKSKLANTGVGITSVIGFPLGACLTNVKAFEAQEAIKAGADEIDMVIHIGKMKEGQYEYVLNDIKEVKKACGKNTLKVIVETALLTKEEIEEVTRIVMKSGAEFIKTSTGFSTRGASLEDVKIMKSICGDTLLIKAAGGISNKADMIAMVEAGANRFGTSRSIAIVEGKDSNEGY
ncbi:deoxyribose-phosphate aldolase [Mycoplasma zalophidermidis]|uniref:deoxyribose-phosphate aldolase n=1 Tax=Mycoplasma zalophidermidis TaxID=398174 RepID=UPI001C106A3A|nr:deoxyribose-phosphate aldolase [Mycoplasma zalophidermidis]MBU4689942.1 deoxyribose-phosphate aldolase [Mycoplasma zalophidermidis]MCR8966773.1 deoxyribose-phosphate aldolase [Mycoplasma zalophidermidis]